MDLNALTMQIDREHDACGIFAQIEKSGVANRKAAYAGIQALKAMRHRAGYVQGEGDGCGVLLDIPKPLWKDILQESGLDGSIVDDKKFFVGHLLFKQGEYENLVENVQKTFEQFGLSVLSVRLDAVMHSALGPVARAENPHFVQVAGLTDDTFDQGLYKVLVQLELTEGVHVASLSRSTVVYKVVGDDDTLWQYYSDLRDERCVSTFVLAHTRYSTNTTTSFSRVQPFSLLGHNGEINTISRFFSEAEMIGISVNPDFSDSQMVDRVIQALISERGWSLFEAAELVFPPIINEIKQMPDSLSDLYMFYRSLWGPFAQGPAGVMMRYGDEAVFSVDALGLRPMWLIETKDAYCFSSEQGIIHPDLWVEDPKPLSPGEKMGIKWYADGIQLYEYREMQQHVLERASARYQLAGEHRNIHFAGPFPREHSAAHPARDGKLPAIRAAAYGFREDDYKLIEAQSQTGGEPIKSLGFDSPIGALNEHVRLLSDFMQETVAVVTNPAIDREREIEHFSTRAVLGRRPSLDGLYSTALRVDVQSPILLEELPHDCDIELQEVQAMAYRHGTLCYEDALDKLHTSVNGTAEILVHRQPGETIQNALKRFEHEVLEAVQAGANAIVLDDRLQFKRGSYIDPLLVLAYVHKSLLRPAAKHGGEHLRRRSSFILRSGGLRNLHDIVVALGLGADAVVPYMMWEIVGQRGSLQALENLYTALTKGLEKVISTLGIHEIRGYERLFGAIGLSDEIANILGIPTFCGTETTGYTFAKMEEEAEERQRMYESETEKQVGRQRLYQLYPRIWKSAGLVAAGEATYDSYVEKLDKFERDNPISLRHVLELQTVEDHVQESSVGEVDTSVDEHAYPFVISSMSFGSQNETAYRAYAEAAYRMNIVGLNGEGGEIKDLLDKYPRNRGRQIASGRFGVNAQLCNHAYVLEIKIGQGAKPGEGGHLPGSKVTVQVANARNASPGVDLISPSNNHDIYSIEDLAQVIYELKEINPDAKVAVKVPVVPNIGTIAVGIVKAGADIVTLSGFDGGTGAARAHAIRHVGLPVEIGVKLAHDALCASGLRDVAEIWADGGMKSGIDVMKMILLGANRVGFGTMAMVAIGCTSCRACHKDTCHVGIATQMTDMEEALEKGVTAFSPREFETSVEQLVQFFGSIGKHVAELTAMLGAKRTQDLVGRRDLLKQFRSFESIHASWLTEMNALNLGKGTVISARTFTADANEWVQSAQTLAVATGTEGVSVRMEASSSAHRAEEYSIQPVPRALGTRESGYAIRNRVHGDAGEAKTFEHYAVGGAGFAAYHSVGMVTVAHGGAQDGVGKGALGGKIVVLKHCGPDGVWRGGSVGKGLAYGAQRGLFIIQGNADARAGIRLSGADVIIGGQVNRHVHDELAFVGTRSNIKGFAFEYMTNGRALVLGDPGPWICSGMTGGTVYLRHDPSVGLTESALRRRLAKGAKVSLRYLDADGDADVVELLQAYQKELRRSGQWAEAQALQPMIEKPAEHFLMVKPGTDITDQDIATE